MAVGEGTWESPLRWAETHPRNLEPSSQRFPIPHKYDYIAKVHRPHKQIFYCIATSILYDLANISKSYISHNFLEQPIKMEGQVYTFSWFGLVSSSGNLETKMCIHFTIYLLYIQFVPRLLSSQGGL